MSNGLSSRRIDRDSRYFVIQIGFYSVGESVGAAVKANVCDLDPRSARFGYFYYILNGQVSVRKYPDFLKDRSAL